MSGFNLVMLIAAAIYLVAIWAYSTLSDRIQAGIPEASNEKSDKTLVSA